MAEVGRESGTPGEKQQSGRDLFVQMLELDPSERLPFLDRSTANSRTPREEILRLLQYREKARDFFAALSADIRPLLGKDPLLAPGTVLAGRFRVSAFLARGGMGEVYAADDLELGGSCALKIMKPGLSLRPGSLARFREEIRLSREISSGHVCRVYDVERHEESGSELIFLTMELLDGITLADRIFLDGPLPLNEARPLIRQMAEGVDAAHLRGILHRDFKSGNVMICREPRGRVVITDFGLSRRIEAHLEDGSLLVDGATPAYAAPEQIEKGDETTRTDVYSFGVVLYELVTGSTPFTGEDELEVVQRKLLETPESPRKLRHDLPKQWETVILRCLERDPAKRFSSAGEVARALGCAGPERGGMLSRRNWILAGAASVPTAALVGRWSWMRLNVVEPPSVAVLPLETETPELRYVADGITDRLTDTLTQLPGIRVVARTAVQRFKDAGKNLAETARQFRVRYLIMGSVKKNGQRLHVTNEIVEAATGLQVWAGTQDLTIQEVERLGLTLCRAVTYSLKIELQPAQLSQTGKPLTTVPEAYEAYLLGRFYAARRSTEALKESIKHFNTAVDRDPGFAAAWAALGFSWYDLSIRETVDWGPLMLKSVKAAKQALQLDPNLWEGHLVMGCNDRNWTWDFRSSLRNLQRACELNPGAPAAHKWYANVMSLLAHHEEAISQVEKAISLDPLSSDLLVGRATILFYAGRTDEALAAYESVLQADPGYENVYIPMSDALKRKGRVNDAIAACEKGVALTHRATYAVASLGRLYGLAGRTQEAGSLLEELRARYRKDGFASDLALVYLGLGEKDRAFEWFELGAQSKDVELIALKVAPEFDVLRSDSRFWGLMKRVGLDA